MARYVIGTRGSKLALAQTTFVKERLAAAYPEDVFELKVISTKGDRVQDRPLERLGGTAVFTAEIQKALLAGEVDLAVHSMKDLAAVEPEGLCLSKAWTRDDPRDALVVRGRGNVVGTGSIRRAHLLKRLRPDLVAKDIRGNVDTRLRKLESGDYDALILAAAGLRRLGLASVITEYLDPHVFVPAPNQGQLAIECRASDTALRAKLDALGDDAAETAAQAERDFLRHTGADCHAPVGAYYENGRLYTYCEGCVSLVGAGPGDPSLITLKGLDRIRRADAIVYDRLVPRELLAEAPAGCRLVYAGKASGHHTLPQDEINALLAHLAHEVPCVVRLKGGDPYVFGRGAEEALYLQAQGLPVEVVPGVTSPVAGLAAAGIPITHRGVAEGFTVVTAHRAEGRGHGPHHGGLGPAGTTVYMMGLAELANIVKGMAPETPVAVISRACTRFQRTVVGTAADIVEKVTAAALETPALVVAGEVVDLREELLPMKGRKVLVRKVGEDEALLARHYRELGAEVTEWTERTVEMLPGAPDDDALAGVTHLVVTSRHAVAALSEAQLAAIRARHVACYAVGLATAELLDAALAGGAEAAAPCTRIPREANAKSLLALLEKELAAASGIRHPVPRTILYLKGEGAPDRFASLSRFGTYRAIDVYRTVERAGMPPEEDFDLVVSTTHPPHE